MYKNNDKTRRSAVLILLLISPPLLALETRPGPEEPIRERRYPLIKPAPAPPAAIPPGELQRARRWCDKALQAFAASRDEALPQAAKRITVYASSGEYSCEAVFNASRLR